VKPPAAPARVKTRAEKDREAFMRRQELANQLNRERLAELRAAKQRAAVEQAPVNPVVARAQEKIKARKGAAPVEHLTAQQLKERAIQNALAQLDRMDTPVAQVVETEVVETIDKKRHFWQSKRFVLAVTLSASAVLLLGYFIHLNMPDISVRVAASRAGMEGRYPNYLPKGYELDGLVSEKSGKVEMTFENGADQFTITQEKSAWDSNALYSNYIQKEWGQSTMILREQGLTIYVNGSDAAWVNGGVKYVIDDAGDALTKQDLRDIAVSL
jgi:hypothetical protein